MREQDLWLVSPPRLSDQAACEMLDFLYEFIHAFEHHYANQLRQPTPPLTSLMDDLFADLNDDDIP